MSTATQDHNLLCEGELCDGLYLESCGDDRCYGCITVHCPCSCHDGQTCSCGEVRSTQ